MTPFQIIAALLTFTAAGSYINQRYMRLPATIGAMAFTLLLSLLAIMLGEAGWIDLRAASALIQRIDFSEVLLHGMLSFLLFAGALHIHADALKNIKWPVALLATGGVAIATFVTGTLVWLTSGWAGLPLSYLYALLFGALISPTDPIAVLAILKEAGLSKTLYTKIGAESLFNDGVGVVAFLTILSLATGAQPPHVSVVLALLARQALGGAALGLLLGWIVYRLLRSIDAYKVEALMTLALVSGGYVLAEALAVSAPICMVAAGLVIGNRTRQSGMSPHTRERLDIFWELLDEILNMVLFVLIGLEVMVIAITRWHIVLGSLAVAAMLIGRAASVGLLLAAMRPLMRLERGTAGILIWGGLRGGLSIAMALSLPHGAEKDIILPITYIVVLFSILVQGLSFKPVLQWLVRPKSG